jgi:hypothetical protein
VDALRAIYRCHNDELQLEDTCYENDEFNRCVKNGRRRGKRFFPFASANRIVCQSKGNVEKPWTIPLRGRSARLIAITLT